MYKILFFGQNPYICNMELSIVARRFKVLRQELGFTQSAFAQRLGLNNTTADIERDRSKPAGWLIAKLLKEYNINPLWIYGESEQKYLNADQQDVAPKVVSVDAEGNENILMVNQKASAGYAGNIKDKAYVETLPMFSFPLPDYRNASFRGFQIIGDSMLPAVKPGDWILAKAVERISDIKNGQVYVIVEEGSVRLKKLENIEKQECVILHSLNKEYGPERISYEGIVELWAFHSRISFDLEEPIDGAMIGEMYHDIKYIKQQLQG